MKLFLGKTLISKERARQTAEKEEQQIQAGDKIKADPVFYISLVGVNKYGMVEEDEYIFDLLTKLYDFNDTDVEVLSAQDLLKFYNSTKGTSLQNIHIYVLVEFFMENNLQNFSTQFKLG